MQDKVYYLILLYLILLFPLIAQIQSSKGYYKLIIVNLALYGPIAKHAGGKYIATLDLELDDTATIQKILEKIKLPSNEKGYLFINSTLCDMPGLNASLNEPLKNGDHVGIFSTTHMWPYQYRDGIRMSESLKQISKEKGAMRNSYRNPGQ